MTSEFTGKNSPDKIADLWTKEKEYICWGAGNLGSQFLEKFSQKLKINAFIDLDESKIGNKYLGYTVISFDDFLSLPHHPLLIITCGVYHEVKAKLEALGFTQNVDFIYDYVFEEIYCFYHENQLSLKECNICITSYCTLKCINCNMRIPEFKEKKHFPLTDIKAEVDDYFRWIDHVQYYTVLGGETFLHPNIYEIIEYVAKNYRKKIRFLDVVTNGTIMPSDGFWDMCRKYNVNIQLSDYSHSIPALSKKVIMLKSVMQEKKIHWHDPHYIGNWLDYGLKDDLGENEETLCWKFQECNNPWRAVYRGRLYFCHLEVSAIRAGVYPIIMEDSFDLSQYSKSRREDLLLYDLRYLPKGYLSYCRICRGCSSVNNKYVPPALQRV